MRIVLLAAACLLIGMIVGNRMAAEGTLPGCRPTPPPSPTVTIKEHR